MTLRGDKWRESMIRRLGSEEALKDFMRSSGAKASRPGTGGFAYMKENDPERLKEISENAAHKKHFKSNDQEISQA